MSPSRKLGFSNNQLYPVNSFLTGNKSSLAFGSVMSFFGIKGAFLRFSRKRQDGWICANLFLGFRRKHLFIITCIEKQCIRPLKPVSGESNLSRVQILYWLVHAHLRIAQR